MNQQTTHDWARNLVLTIIDSLDNVDKTDKKYNNKLLSTRERPDLLSLGPAGRRTGPEVPAGPIAGL